MIYGVAFKKRQSKASYRVTGIKQTFPATRDGFSAALDAGAKRWNDTMLRTELTQGSTVINYWDTATDHEPLF